MHRMAEKGKENLYLDMDMSFARPLLREATSTYSGVNLGLNICVAVY